MKALLETFAIIASLFIATLAGLIFHDFDKINDGSEIRSQMLWLFAAKMFTYFVIAIGLMLMFTFDMIDKEPLFWLVSILLLAHLPKVIVMWRLWRYIKSLHE